MTKFKMVVFMGALALCSSINGAPAKSAAPVDCSMLTDDEQEFAMQLNDVNKGMFCSKFTPDQRSAAMEMMGQPDSNGTPMSANMAVQKVGGAPAPAKPAQKSGGGCPVK